MKLNLFFNNGIFSPAFDKDYEKAKALKKKTIYTVSVRESRNLEFNRKYHVMIDKAWECLNEQQISFFGEYGKESFRKSLEITAGFYIPVFSFERNEWQQVPRSTSFESMDESEFNDLYNGVLSVIRRLLTNKSMSDSEFDVIFEQF